MSSKAMKRVVKVLILAMIPWFTTGCALFQALGGLLGKGGSGLPTAGAIGSGTTAAVAPKPVVPLVTSSTPSLLKPNGSAVLANPVVAPPVLAYVERVPGSDIS